MDLKIINEHKNWADDTYVEYCRKLTDEEFNRKIPGYDNSIRKITMHIYEVSWNWYIRMTDGNFNNQPDWDSLSKEQILTGILNYNKKISEFLENDNISKEIKIQWHNSHKPLISTPENFIFNFITHNAYHRGQLAIYLRILGIPEIKETDFNPYLYELAQR